MTITVNFIDQFEQQKSCYLNAYKVKFQNRLDGSKWSSKVLLWVTVQ